MFGDGDVSLADGKLTIVDTPAEARTGVHLATMIGSTAPADFEATLRRTTTAVAPNEVFVTMGPLVDDFYAICEISSVGAGCFQGTSETGAALPADVAIDDRVDFVIELRPDQGLFHYRVNGREIGSLAIPDEIGDQPGRFMIVVDNISEIGQVVGQAGRATVRPIGEG